MFKGVAGRPPPPGCKRLRKATGIGVHRQIAGTGREGGGRSAPPHLSPSGLEGREKLRLIHALARLSGASLLALSQAAAAQDAPAGADAVPVAGVAEETVVDEALAGDVYTPGDFAAFAPRNALDLVRRIPGFTISDGDNGRGLGQANQNVLVDGDRLSSKSDSLRDQLQRIPVANVVRIEVVDGNTLDIPGLTGQVANIVTSGGGGISGQFEWRTGFRAYNTSAQLYGGEVSVAGSSGALDYTVALSNDNNRFGADGEILIENADGTLIERQDTKFSGRFDNPKLAATLAYDFGGGVRANLNGSYGQDYFARREPESGFPAIGPVRTRALDTDETGPEYEIGGDVEFPLGPGRLKLIGLERFERDKRTTQLVDRFDDLSPSEGFRFAQTNGIGERIGRGEYSWQLWGADWQLSGEAAFNRLDRASSLFELRPDGRFVELDFPAGTGGVSEDRYETSLSFSRKLTGTLSMQAIAAMEFSTIEQTGSAANARSFKRPKGSLATTWKPSDRFDVSVTLARRVDQLDFGDFLASVSLNDDNENAGNNELVPYQSWNVDVEANRKFGAWGSVKLEARHAWFSDFTDWIPLPGGGEARGNVGDAQRTQLEVTATIKMDPIGWRGARFDISAVKRFMTVTDPFTGLDRPFSGDLNSLLDIDFRHDIPASDWAYGASLFTEDRAPYSRLFEIGRGYEGPVFADLFVENKDVLGLTVRAEAANLLGATQNFERTVFDGPRPGAPVAFFETYRRRIGPIFRFAISGNF